MWSYVRHYDENMFERLQANGYISTLDESIFEKTEDEIILCLGYDGLYGVNNINRYMQKVNPSNPVEWGNWVYKVGDKVLFNDNKRFGSVLYNNLKGTIVTIDRKDEEKMCIRDRHSIWAQGGFSEGTPPYGYYRATAVSYTHL